MMQRVPFLAERQVKCQIVVVYSLSLSLRIASDILTCTKLTSKGLIVNAHIVDSAAVAWLAHALRVCVRVRVINTISLARVHTFY